MGKRTVRIESVFIENFKNVQNGMLEFENRKKDYRASIVGLYGQNGSGKTALIDAIQLLKYSLCGQPIPNKYVDYINIDAADSRLKFRFKMESEKALYDIWYQFRMRKVTDDTSINFEEDITNSIKYKVEVFDEVLEYAFVSATEKDRKGILIDTRTEGAFIPKSKYRELLGGYNTNNTDVLITKRVVQAQSKSFIFSREMINAFRTGCDNSKYMTIIDGLVTFGNRELFIINTENAGWISMNALPLAFKYKYGTSEAVGNLMLPLNGPAPIPEEAFELIKKIVRNMNIVLAQLVPGLTIGIIDLGVTVFQDGKVGRQIQIMSLKNQKAIPFQYESEGIKKLCRYYNF